MTDCFFHLLTQINYWWQSTQNVINNNQITEFSYDFHWNFVNSWQVNSWQVNSWHFGKYLNFSQILWIVPGIWCLYIGYGWPLIHGKDCPFMRMNNDAILLKTDQKFNSILLEQLKLKITVSQNAVLFSF